MKLLFNKLYYTPLLDSEVKDHTYKLKDDLYVIQAEKYYMRVGAKLVLTLVINLHDQQNCTISIFTGGGSSMFSVKWGADEHFLSKAIEEIEQVCEQNGFQISKRS